MLKTLASFGRFPHDIQLYIVGFGAVAFGYFGIWGVLFNLYLLRLGYGTESIGLLVGGGQLAWGLASVPAAMVGDRIGNRLAMIWGIGMSAVALILLLTGQWLPAPLRTGWIAIWWIVTWIGSALMLVNGTPYVMATCPVEDRRNAITIVQVSLGFCGFLGSMVAGALPEVFARWSGRSLDDATVYWYVLWFTPLAYLAATYILSRTKPLPPLRREIKTSTDTKMPLFIIVFVGLLVYLQSTGEGTMRAFFNVYLDTTLDVSTTRIGLVMGIGQFLPIITSLTAPWLMDRWGTGNTIIVAGVVTALSLLLLVFFSNWAVASTGYIGVLLTISVAAIARSLFSQEVVAPQWRTLMSAVFTIGIAFGWSSAAGIGGFIISSFGYSTLFLFGAIMAGVSGILVWVYLRMNKPAAVDVPAAST